MKKAILTVDLGFGDSGKGSVVDYLCREHGADLVVRYNGGHQCGHNVYTPDGKHHTFSQFGSGTLASVPTYIGANCIVEPLGLLEEEKHLKELGIDRAYELLSINKHALVCTPWHIGANRLQCSIVNTGTCGLGIGVTREFWLRNTAIYYKDLLNPVELYSKLQQVRQTILNECNQLLNNVSLSVSPSEMDIVMEHTYPILRDMYKVDVNELVDIYRLVANRVLNVNTLLPFDCAIFEGAQGVLLDEYCGFHPYTTWSTTTTQHAHEEIKNSTKDCEVETLGLTRCYMTRHGYGPFPTEQEDINHYDLPYEVNGNDGYQGKFRVGNLDIPLLKYALKCQPVDGLVVTCLDHKRAGTLPICIKHDFEDPKYPGVVPKIYTEMSDLEPTYNLHGQTHLTAFLLGAKPRYEENITAIEAIQKYTKVPIKYISKGPTFKDKLKV